MGYFSQCCLVEKKCSSLPCLPTRLLKTQHIFKRKVQVTEQQREIGKMQPGTTRIWGVVYFFAFSKESKAKIKSTKLQQLVQ